MQWNSISSLDDIEGIISTSHNRPQLIFKHSTRCSVSTIAKMRIEDKWHSVIKDIDFHFLDLISFKAVSDHIAEKLDVNHQSPQVILLDKSEVIYDASHFDITIEELNESLSYYLGRS